MISWMTTTVRSVERRQAVGRREEGSAAKDFVWSDWQNQQAYSSRCSQPALGS